MLVENHPYPEDTRVCNEAETLAAAGFRVTVVAPRRGRQLRTETIAGVRVRRYRIPLSSGTRRGYVTEYLVAHLQLFLNGARGLLEGSHVVHLHNPPDTLFPVARLARLIGRRAVYDLHDLAPELFVEKFGPSWVVRVLRWAQRASLRSADAVLVTNESQRALALEVVPKATVVRNGPRRATLAERSAARAGMLDDPRLLFVGNLETQDGALALPALLEALHREHDLRGARLTVAGDGCCAPELQAWAERAGLEGALCLLGRVPRRQVPGLVAAADICLEPAPCGGLNDRLSMIKVAEYLAGGRPVVAFDLLETRRTAGDAALYARCGDAAHLAELVATVARDGALRRDLGVRACARAEALVWERSAEALVDVYRGL